jgi:hypothetical protein
MTCLSTTLQQQRQKEFNALLRIFFAVALVLAAVGEATDVKFPVIGLILGLLLVLSTTLQQQRQDGLLRIFFTVSLVLAVVDEAAALTSPLIGSVLGLFLVPLYLYYRN